MKMLRRHSSVTTTPTKEEEEDSTKITAALLTDDNIAIDYTISPSRSYVPLDNEDNDVATGGSGGDGSQDVSLSCSRSIIVTQSANKPTLLTRSQSTPTTIPSHSTNTNNIATTKTIGTINNTLTLKTFDTNTSTPKRSTKISEAYIKINNMASQIKHSQKLIEEQESIDRDSLWEVVKKIDNGATTSNNKMVDGGNNMESKLDTTAETVPNNEEEGGEGAPSLEWTVDWNLCNTSNTFSANPCGGGGTNSNCAPSNNLCGAKECWDNVFDNDVFACNDFFDLNATNSNKADINNAATPNNNVNNKNGQVVQIAEEYNEVIEINDKVAADISAGKDVDGSMSQSLAVVEWLKDEYMASIGASEIDNEQEKEGTTIGDEFKGKKELPSSPTSVLDCAVQSSLSSSVAEVTSAISSMPTSMCKQETIVSSTIACCGVFDSIVQIPQSFNDVVTCQLFPESSDNDDAIPKSDSGGEKVASSEVKSDEGVEGEVASDEVGKVDDYKMVSSEELGLKLPPPKEDSDSSGCDSVGGLCENIDQVFISEDDEDVIVDDDNSQPSI